MTHGHVRDWQVFEPPTDDMSDVDNSGASTPVRSGPWAKYMSPANSDLGGFQAAKEENPESTASSPLNIRKGMVAARLGNLMPMTTVGLDDRNAGSNVDENGGSLDAAKKKVEEMTVRKTKKVWSDSDDLNPVSGALEPLAKDDSEPPNASVPVTGEGKKETGDPLYSLVKSMKDEFVFMQTRLEEVVKAMKDEVMCMQTRWQEESRDLQVHFVQLKTTVGMIEEKMMVAFEKFEQDRAKRTAREKTLAKTLEKTLIDVGDENVATMMKEINKLFTAVTAALSKSGDSVEQLLIQGDHNKALELAIDSHDQNLILDTCVKVNLEQMFIAKGPLPFTSVALISLARELGNDIVTDIEIKCKYIQLLLLHLNNSSDEKVRAYWPTVKEELRKNVDEAVETVEPGGTLTQLHIVQEMCK